MAEATDRTAGVPAPPDAAGDARPLHAADHPAGRGLRLSRFFTRDGTHPYEEVEWELRDAVIKNWRDGTVSFEQRGVEFPKTWSMNATTIVAQKYFRGPLGTPQRERSVRQMIDRVADTVTSWGRKDGYFADDASAEVFNAELKHLLVNQKMAFNSPVWFNVGVEERPQCSACFILAVEDTMASILNWYVEEGLIFKGGSGSGVNLSRLRSNKEQLKGGGEASGPVSFMRGADASAGTIKCLHEDTPVVTDRGVVPIRDVAAGDQVITRFGYRQVDAVHDNGVQPLVRVRTALGDEILCTPEHRFLIRGRDGEIWREAKDLRSDDHVVIDLSATGHGNPQHLTSVDEGHHRERRHELPDALDEAFALWLGWIFGDGSITDRGYSHFVAMQIGDEDPELPGRYRALTRTVFGSSLQLVESRHVDRSDASTSVRFASSQIIRFLEVNGLRKPKTQDLRVPALVASSPATVRAAFLSGLFEADGHVGNGYPWLSTVSLLFARDVHRLLLSIGIPSTIGRIDDRRAAWGDKPMFTVRVVGAEGVRRFAKLVGFVSQRKSRRLEQAVARKDASSWESQWVLPHVGDELSLIWETVPSPDMRRAIAPYARYSSQRGMSLLRARRLVERFPELMASSLGRFSDGGVLYVPVSVEAAGQGHTYDLSVAGVHEYLVNSVVTHNSGGKTRRAAKMVVLNVDHPDIEEFIWCKAREERKIRILREAGLDMDLDSPDYASIQYQNANNSIRVTDEFMRAWEHDASYDLRAVTTGDVLDRKRARDVMRQIAEAAWECADPGMQYDTTINRWHTCPESGRINASNPCSEYMHLDNSACNLASLNLKKFYDYDADRFDVEAYKRAIEITILAQEILVGNSSYPTDKIAETAVAFRQLGLGYANLGGLLMSLGLPYDSDEGRAWCGALTALLTGHAYRTSAEIAKVTGPFAGYAKNASAMLEVVAMHGDEAEKIDPRPVPGELLGAAKQAWKEAYELGQRHGFRNSQATVLAPTGCLVGGTLVPTDRGLVRLASLGDPAGSRWQDLDAQVMTDDGPKDATRFYVNGLEAVVTVTTARGHRLRGTPRHRVRVLDPEGRWVWRRFADLRTGDRVPLALDQLVGEPRDVALPAVAGDGSPIRLPRRVTARLAEFVGFVAGAGRVDGDRLCVEVAAADLDVVDHLRVVAKDLFDLDADVSESHGRCELTLVSPLLVRWWERWGFPTAAAPSLPDVLLASNDRGVYAAFVRGLFEAAGTVTVGYPHWSTTAVGFSADVQSLLLALGFSTSRRVVTSALDNADRAVLDVDPPVDAWVEAVGFVGARKSAQVRPDTESPDASAWLVDLVAAVELGDDEPTYDLSVPDNVTYVANGFVSHNTIGLMMDCDTTGIEPDLGLVKIKKLVGGGSMSIVNRTIPQALRRLGYNTEQIEAVVAHIDEHGTILGAPAIRDDHLAVFSCAMGDNAIHYMGHVRMMAAAQPFISGAISKCVASETLIASADGLVRIGSLHDGEPADSFRDHVIEVASLQGTQKTDAFYYGGVRPVREVVLRSGHRVVGTPNHRLLVATAAGLEWKMLDDLQPGDHVATRYGTEMWAAVPARFDDSALSPWYGREKDVRIPSEMTEDLAFLLGAYASAGCSTRSTWTVSITSSSGEVLDRVRAAWMSVFGLEASVGRSDNRCADVRVRSKEVVEFLDYLGCGVRAAERRIPDAVLRSPRQMVLAFLQGLALDAYTTWMGTSPKWGICSDSPGLLDDLQAVLTNFGVVHGRISTTDANNGKPYDEVYAVGREAQKLIELVPFVAPNKGGRAEALPQVQAEQSPMDVVAGITPAELFALIPDRTRSGGGRSPRTEFSFLADRRTTHVSRRTLERVAAIPGVKLPDWVETVLGDNLHFSPVASVGDVEPREVFDLSVPTTHAFLGNGIVNHNTVNMPEEATVEDIEQLFYDAWKLGLKAIAIYRDNCKVAQPLAITKTDKTAQQASGPVEVREGMVRRKLPKQRPSQTISFRVADAEGYLTCGEYPGDGLGEIFVKLGKQGSTLSGVMDAFAISVSLGLQYGVPLEAYVQKFMNMRFEPAGMTDDDEIRFSTSIVDYIARKLAVEYLPEDKRQELGIFTTEERTSALDAQYGVADDAGTAPPPAPQPALPSAAAEQPASVPYDADAPLCYVCGTKMKRAGSCHVCEQCGATSGCS